MAKLIVVLCHKSKYLFRNNFFYQTPQLFPVSCKRVKHQYKHFLFDRSTQKPKKKAICFIYL